MVSKISDFSRFGGDNGVGIMCDRGQLVTLQEMVTTEINPDSLPLGGGPSRVMWVWVWFLIPNPMVMIRAR